MTEGVQVLSIYEKRWKLRVVRLQPMLYTCVGKLRLEGKKERQMKSHTMRSEVPMQWIITREGQRNARAF